MDYSLLRSTCPKPVNRKLTTHCSGRGNSGGLWLGGRVRVSGGAAPAAEQEREVAL
jgi:hypothetical protein